MRDFLLDTQTVRYWHDTRCAQHAALVGNVNQLRAIAANLSPPITPKLLISVITRGEIEFGHLVALNRNLAAQAAYVAFVEKELPDVLEPSADASLVYGELRTRLFNKYAPGAMRTKGMRPEQLLCPVTSKTLEIQENDLWIASQAIAHGLVLVTNDRMTRIRDVATGMSPPLIIQNWTVPNTASIGPP